MAWELTRGQPWLVNPLARQVVGDDVTDRITPITPVHLEAAKEIVIGRRDSHLDSLVDRLREPRVQRIIEPILAGEMLPPDTLSDDIACALDLGLVARGAAELLLFDRRTAAPPRRRLSSAARSRRSNTWGDA